MARRGKKNTSYVKLAVFAIISVGILTALFLLNFRQALFQQAAPQEPLPISLQIYTDKERAQLMATELKPYIRPEDIFIIGVGGRSMKTVNETSDILKKAFPNNRIFAATSIKNLDRVSKEASPNIELVALDDEQSNYPNWTWDFPTALSNIDSAMNMVRANGKQAGIIPPGSALRDDLFKKYRWNYAEVGALADYQVIMMQGSCRRDHVRFTNNMKTLVKQYNGQVQNLSVLLALGDTANGVPTSVAYECAKIAYESGITNIGLFDAERLDEFLRMVRPLDANLSMTPTHSQPPMSPTPSVNSPTPLPPTQTPTPTTGRRNSSITPVPSGATRAQVPIILYPDPTLPVKSDGLVLVSIPDTRQLQKVEVFIDGTRQETLLPDRRSILPHYFEPIRFSVGQHTVYAIAYYRGGITAKSPTVTFRIERPTD